MVGNVLYCVEIEVDTVTAGAETAGDEPGVERAPMEVGVVVGIGRERGT